MTLQSIEPPVVFILILWCIGILAIGRINKSSKISRYFSVGFYGLLLLLPLFMGFRVEINFNKTVLVYSLIGLVGGLALLLPKFKIWYLVLSYDFIGIKNRKPNLHYLSSGGLMLLTAILEEFFYRGFIISSLENHHFLLMIFMSTFMYVLHPVEPKRSKNSAKKDKELQILFGALSSILYVLSGSILPSFVAHIAYTLPDIALPIRSYIYWNFKASQKE